MILLTEYHAKRCLPLRANDVACGSDVHCVNDVTPDGAVGKYYIIVSGANNITFAIAKTSLTEKERTFRIQNRFVLSFCRYKGLDLAQKAFVRTKAMLAFSDVFLILR